MILIDVKQGSSEWLLQRYGIPTASNAKSIITAATGKRSESQDKYISELVAERHAKKTVIESIKRLGISDNDIDSATIVENIEHILNRIKTEAMTYGNETEPKAASAYEFLRDCELQEAGFMLNDQRTAGASLDRLIKGEKKGVEFKCPFSLNVHVGYALSRNIEVDKKPQLQWQMWVSELESIDICAYYPGAVTVIVTANRDDEYIKKIAEYHSEFYERLEERWASWQEMQSKK